MKMIRHLLIFILSFIMVLSSSFSVFASSTIVDMPFAEPATSSTQGYLVALTEGGNKYVFFWSINPRDSEGSADTSAQSSMSLTLNSDGIIFYPATAAGVNASYHITSASSAGILRVRATGTFQGAAESFSWDSDIAEVCYYGNVGTVNNNLGTTDKWLRVNWGSSESLNDISDALDDILERLGFMDGSLSIIASNSAHLEGIDSSLDNIEGGIVDVNNSLQEIRSTLTSYWKTTNAKLEETVALLSQIVNAEGHESLEDLDDSDITDLESAEDGVITDDSDRLDDLNLSFGNAFDVVWNLISEAWQANSKVFTVVIMCLTIGVLKLILNR